MLVRDFQLGRHPRIVLFLEAGLARPEGDGHLFLEQGNRTRYLGALANRSDTVVLWSRFDDLVESVLRQSRTLWHL